MELLSHNLDPSWYFCLPYRLLSVWTMVGSPLCQPPGVQTLNPYFLKARGDLLPDSHQFPCCQTREKAAIAKQHWNNQAYKFLFYNFPSPHAAGFCHPYCFQFNNGCWAGPGRHPFHRKLSFSCQLMLLSLVQAVNSHKFIHQPEVLSEFWFLFLNKKTYFMPLQKPYFVLTSSFVLWRKDSTLCSIIPSL